MDTTQKTCTPDANGICPPPPTVSCIPPLLWHTERCECPDGGTLRGIVDGVAICAAPQPAIASIVCEVRIQYPQGDPASPVLVGAGVSGCDAAGMELAVAVIVAKLLGGR